MAGSGDFEVLENGSIAASGNIRVLEDPVHKFSSPATSDVTNGVMGTPDMLDMNSDDVYKELRLRGYDYGPTFQGIAMADNHGNYGIKITRFFRPANVIYDYVIYGCPKFSILVSLSVLGRQNVPDPPSCSCLRHTLYL